MRFGKGLDSKAFEELANFKTETIINTRYVVSSVLCRSYNKTLWNEFSWYLIFVDEHNPYHVA